MSLVLVYNCEIINFYVNNPILQRVNITVLNKIIVFYTRILESRTKTLQIF